MAESITTILLHDKSDGPKWIKVGGRVTMLFVLPRPTMRSIFCQKDYSILKTPGLYILMSSEDKMSERRIYIGEADDCVKRLTTHLTDKSKNWFDTAYIFVDGTNQMDDAQAKHLEYRAIAAANASLCCSQLENQQKPHQKHLSKDREVVANRIFEEIYQLSLFVGLDIFVPENIDSNTEYHIDSKWINARGKLQEESGKFIIYAESEIIPDCVNSFKNKILRQNLITSLTYKNKEGKVVLKRNVIFNSPSGASSFILGRPSNGWTDWKDENGKTLSEVNNKEKI